MQLRNLKQCTIACLLLTLPAELLAGTVTLSYGIRTFEFDSVIEVIVPAGASYKGHLYLGPSQLMTGGGQGRQWCWETDMYNWRNQDWRFEGTINGQIVPGWQTGATDKYGISQRTMYMPVTLSEGPHEFHFQGRLITNFAPVYRAAVGIFNPPFGLQLGRKGGPYVSALGNLNECDWAHLSGQYVTTTPAVTITYPDSITMDTSLKRQVELLRATGTGSLRVTYRLNNLPDSAITISGGTQMNQNIFLLDVGKDPVMTMRVTPELMPKGVTKGSITLDIVLT